MLNNYPTPQSISVVTSKKGVGFLVPEYDKVEVPRNSGVVETGLLNFSSSESTKVGWRDFGTVMLVVGVSIVAGVVLYEMMKKIRR